MSAHNNNLLQSKTTKRTQNTTANCLHKKNISHSGSRRKILNMVGESIWAGKQVKALLHTASWTKLPLSPPTVLMEARHSKQIHSKILQSTVPPRPPSQTITTTTSKRYQTHSSFKITPK